MMKASEISRAPDSGGDGGAVWYAAAILSRTLPKIWREQVRLG